MLWKVLKWLRGSPLGLTAAVLCWQAFSLLGAAPPPNDLCSGAEVIPGAGPFPYRSIVMPDISGATDAGDPNSSLVGTDCEQVVSRGVWYKFTPSVSTNYLLSVNDTATTVEDTLMAVYTSAGGCAGPFVLFACNDDAGFTQSAILTNLTANTPYYIVVWKVATNAPLAGQTAVQLKISKPVAPANDLCTGAELIPAAGPFPYFTSTNDTLLATTNSDPPSLGCLTTTARRSVWYRFSPSSAGVYWFTTVSNTATRALDTGLVIYSTPSGCGGPFTVVACNDDYSASEYRSAISATLTAGAVYYIVVWDVEAGGSDPGFNTVQLGVWRIGPPAAATLAASSLTSTTVVFNATVTPNASNETTSVLFNWGLTTNYGNSTPAVAVSSNVVRLLVSSMLTTNLLPNTNYHYRVVASNSKGTTNGADRTFFWSTNRPSITSYKFQSNGTFRLQFAGNSNQIYRLEATVRLGGSSNWVDIAGATDLGNGNFEFIDYDAVLYQRSFYRFKAP